MVDQPRTSRSSDLPDTTQRTSRRRGSPVSRFLRHAFRLLVLALITVPVGAVIFSLARPLEADRAWIGFERYWRSNVSRLGLALPGTPDLADFNGRLKAQGLAAGNPVLIRIFKREFELELWMMRDGRFERFATYPICKWSGQLGPKIKQGDRQAPEGFYTVDQKALNPKSAWHRSFNLGFPNAFDKALGRTGSFLMVHGGCGSIGCYAMTNPVIDEIWQLVTAALKGGQQRFQVQVLPFRMTEANLERYAGSPQAPFWASLKPGYDLFEASRVPPKVSVCGTRYSFSAGADGSNGSNPIEQACPAG
jgi:murein L,D-transpeptidase YafK